MIPFNPFARITSAIAARILGAVAAAAIAATIMQTVRIEGAFCRQMKLGEKPACIIQGFKQQLATIRIDLEQVRRDRDAERQRAETEHANHEQTKRNYTAAQKEVQRLEAERLARARARQERVNTDASQDYARRIGDLRGRYDRLRGQGPAGVGVATAGGAGGGFPLPLIPLAAGGADAPATGEGLPRDELEWRYVASAQAEQLDALISWILAQAEIDPNNP
jgi:hypothetical protein